MNLEAYKNLEFGIDSDTLILGDLLGSGQKFRYNCAEFSFFFGDKL